MSILSELSGHLLYCLCFSLLVLLQLKELEEAWRELPVAPPAPTRFTRSQQAKMAEAGPVTPVAVDGDETTVQQGISAFGDRLTSWLLSLKGETNMYPFFSHIFLQILMLLVMVGYLLFKESSFICHKLVLYLFSTQRSVL